MYETDHTIQIQINAMNRGIIKSAIFTVYLEERGPYDNVPGGYITYGSLDTVHCSPVISYHPLTTADFFQFQLDSIQFGVGHQFYYVNINFLELY